MKKNAFFWSLVIVLAFGLISCDTGGENGSNGNNEGSGNGGGGSITQRPKTDYYGSWKGDNGLWTFIIEEDKWIEKYSDYQYMTYEHLTWETFVNPNEKTKDVFPIGYKITSIRTENPGFSAHTVGVVNEYYFYRHKILNAITIGIPEVINNFTLYYKQP